VIKNAVKEVKVKEPSNDLEDMVVLVVGCGTPGSIGSAIAQALADAGAALVLSDLATSKLAAVGQDLADRGHRVLTQAVDLVSENSVEELVSFAQKSFGRFDAVVNAAAATNLLGRDRGVTDMEAALWDQMFAVNVRGAMFICKHAIPAMLAGSGGSIVHISAGKALRGDVDTSAYSASKAALNALTRSVATIYGELGIRCNAIAPGAIATELVNSIVPPAMAKVIRDCTLLGELGDPEDIANLAVFLVSKRSKFITAQTIQVDGGTFDYNPVRYGLRKLSTEDQVSSLRESRS
jgi:NAD(P)-dependent dehydrogenase (short-subunit alcohol dehydrogenase family)